MPTYISLLTYTDQGIRNIKDSPKRLDAAKKLFKELGGELKQFYLTMGPYDAVVVFEAPSPEVMARFLLTLGSLGNVRTETLTAFSGAEYRQIVLGEGEPPPTPQPDFPKRPGETHKGRQATKEGRHGRKIQR